MKDPRYFDPKERDESFVKRVDDAFPDCTDNVYGHIYT